MKKDLNEKSEKSKKNLPESENEKSTTEEKSEDYLEEDEFNPSLAAMEQEIKPQII